MNRKKGYGPISVVLVGAALIAACSADHGSSRITPEYDKTGKLQLLKYDANGDGVVDTWSYMDGARVVRIEIDKDQDGTIDRWEYYGPGQKLERIGFSRQNDGTEDAWSYAMADGGTRIELSSHRDRRVDRIEYYTHDVMVRAEEDTDGDGKIDKWETYDGARLASVAFDTTHRGTADRRLRYAADGTAVMEIDPQGEGHFVPAPAAEPRRR